MAISVLQVNRLNSNPLSSIMSAGDQSLFTFERLAELRESISARERIIIGLDDSGEEYDLDVLTALLDAGSVVIFTHSNPSRTVSRLPEETEDAWELRQTEYLEKLALDFGVDGFEDGFQYVFYTHVVRKLVTPIIGVATDFNVQLTHSTGMRLTSECRILANDPNVPDGPTNWYLATYLRTPGIVIHWNAGHCDYGRNTIADLTPFEKLMAVRMLT